MSSTQTGRRGRSSLDVSSAEVEVCRGELDHARTLLTGVEPARRPLRFHPTTWFAAAELTVSLLQLRPHLITAELREVQTRVSFGFLEFHPELTGWQVALHQPRWGWVWQRALHGLLPRTESGTQQLLATLLADDTWVRCNQASTDLRIRAAQPRAPLPWAAIGAAEVRRGARLVAALRHPDPTASRLAWELGFEIDCAPRELMDLAAAVTQT